MNVYWEEFARAREREVRALADSALITEEHRRPSRLLSLRRAMGRGIIGVGLIVLGDESRHLDQAA